MKRCTMGEFYWDPAISKYNLRGNLGTVYIDEKSKL